MQTQFQHRGKKLGYKNSKSGCNTCRRRRIKCDENKPICLRCLKAGQACYGVDYASLTSLSKTPNPVQGPFGAGADIREKQLSYLLRTTTIDQTTGSFDQAFWSQDVLIAACMSPTIWYAANAFAAMHRRMRLVGSRDASDRFMCMEYYNLALTQYNKAIQHLIQLTSQSNGISYQDKEIILLASALFTGICCLYRNMKQAVVHIENAVKLLSEWRFADLDRKQQGLLSRDSLINLIATLQYQMLDINVKADTLPQPQVTMPLLSAAAASVPFNSANEAYLAFMQITYRMKDLWLFYIRQGPINDTVAAWRLWQDNFAHYRVTYQRSRNLLVGRQLSRSSAETLRISSEDDNIELLELLRQVYDIGLTSTRPKDNNRSEYDRLLPKFRTLLAAAEQLLSRESRENSHLRRPVFSFTLSVNHVLRIIGMVCYPLGIRERVIELLIKWPQQDGFLDSRIDAFIIETKIKFTKNAIRRALQNDPHGCACQGEYYACDKHKFYNCNMEFPRPGIMTMTVGNSEQIDANLLPEIYTLELET